jgi:hypothetical protein
MRREYLRLQVSIQSIKDSDPQLEAAGNDGCELIAVVEAGSSYFHLWFKRRRR